MEEVVKYLRALVYLQVQALSDSAPVKRELLLCRAGFSHKEIGEILGKKPDAVRKVISRAIQAEAKGNGDE